MKQLLKNLLNHERFQTISVAFCIFVVLWMFGCQAKINSVLYPDKQITRAELEMEIDQFMATAQLRYNQLDQQDQLRQLLMENALLVSSGGAINFAGLIPTVFAILGVGAVVDNSRKRRELKRINNS